MHTTPLAGTALLIKDVGFVPVLIGLVVVFAVLFAYRLWWQPKQQRNRSASPVDPPPVDQGHPDNEQDGR